jgi:hypothetical protein
MKKRPQKVRTHRFHSLDIFIKRVEWFRLMDEVSKMDLSPQEERKFGLKMLRSARAIFNKH